MATGLLRLDDTWRSKRRTGSGSKLMEPFGKSSAGNVKYLFCKFDSPQIQTAAALTLLRAHLNTLKRCADKIVWLHVKTLLVLNAADKGGQIRLFSFCPSPLISVLIQLSGRVCVFKMMDRVMLLVNNSLRCRLRSLCPSHRSQSETFARSALIGGNVGKTRPLCKLYCCILSFLAFLFNLSFPLCLFSQSVRRGSFRVLKFYIFPLVISVFPHLSVICSFYHLHLPVFSFLFSLSLSLPPSPDPSASRRSEKHRLHPDVNLLKRE